VVKKAGRKAWATQASQIMFRCLIEPVVIQRKIVCVASGYGVASQRARQPWAA
jgi:hypothetical protein